MEASVSKNILEVIMNESKTVPEERKKHWVDEKVKTNFKDVLPNSLLETLTAAMFDGDTSTSMDVKPNWLDLDKFHKGQQFAMKNYVGIVLAEISGLYTIFAFEHGLRPLVSTGASSTPYTAFKRYLSTALRIQNWYSSDPWTKDTPAYNDIKTVRKMHSLVRKKLDHLSDEDFKRKSGIKDSLCPGLEATRNDFRTYCPKPPAKQCLYNEILSLKGKHLNQAGMICTQFAFVGFVTLRPELLGIHNVTDDELEAFCHLWRGLGYLLGIDDDFNFCRGTLKDVRIRSNDLINYWIKPSFREMKPECEHMMRCVVEGVNYYIPIVFYETVMLNFANMIDIQVPQYYNTLTYYQQFKYGAVRFYINYLMKFSGPRLLINYLVKRAIEKAKNYDEKKHNELQNKSERTLSMVLHKNKMIDFNIWKDLKVISKNNIFSNNYDKILLGFTLVLLIRIVKRGYLKNHFYTIMRS